MKIFLSFSKRRKTGTRQENLSRCSVVQDLLTGTQICKTNCTGKIHLSFPSFLYDFTVVKDNFFQLGTCSLANKSEWQRHQALNMYCYLANVCNQYNIGSDWPILEHYLALINRAGGLYGRILTEVVSTDRTQRGLYTRPRSRFSHTDLLLG